MLFGVFILLFVVILLDLIYKDDMSEKGQIIEVDQHSITVITEKQRKKKISKRFLNPNHVYLKDQKMVILETRRSCILKSVSVVEGDINEDRDCNRARL